MNKELSYNNCRFCARECAVNRTVGELGFCRSTDKLRVARAALHFWEEPPISGENGSGTIFFSGCSLGCIYCQNREISRGGCGREISVLRLAEIMLELRSKGAHNVNLVTPTHFLPSIKEALVIAKEKGLDIPIVYNTGSYDTTESLKSLEGLIDIYLPDLKYYLPKTAKAFSLAEAYPNIARCAIAEMVRQQPSPIIKDGIMQRGVIVRILLLPGHVAEAKLSLKYLHDTYGDSIYISLMNQYTPPSDFEIPSPLDRRVSRAEYSELVEYALRLGVKNAFTQDGGTATENFIPAFDNTGV